MTAAFANSGGITTQLLGLIYQELIANGAALLAFFQQIVAIVSGGDTPTAEQVHAIGKEVGANGTLIQLLIQELATNGPKIMSFILSIVSIFTPSVPAPTPTPVTPAS
jgi:hypothetical protein